MRVAEHLAKAQKIRVSLRKLSFPLDYLAIVDGALVIAYHFGNALLHQYGVLPESDHANSPSRLEQPLDSLPQAIQPAFRAFAELERLRFDYVRSPSTYHVGLDEKTWALLEEMQRAALKGV